MSNIIRCSWAEQSDSEQIYHDNEWGRLTYDDRLFFERLSLELMQAGLSWATILNKRENFRKAFDNFQPEIIAKYDQNKIDELLQDAGIVRNKLKVNAIVNNAVAYLELLESGTHLKDFFWQYLDHSPVQNRWEFMEDIPATTPVSERISKDLKKLGFRFVGPTIIYALMQATGMVNDHLVSCYVYEDIAAQKLDIK